VCCKAVAFSWWPSTSGRSGCCIWTRCGGVQVSADFFFYDVPLVSQLLAEAGFEIVETLERDPYPEVEHPSRRGYLLARR